MQSLAERLANAEREIAMAIEESKRPHTEQEHVGILFWEMDWAIASYSKTPSRRLLPRADEIEQ
jgi:hypothetical protein